MLVLGFRFTMIPEEVLTEFPALLGHPGTLVPRLSFHGAWEWYALFGHACDEHHA